MAWKRWIAGMACVMFLLMLSLPVVSAAVSTVPDLPALSASQSETSDAAPSSSQPESESDSSAVAVQSDNRMILIGIVAWVAFLAVAGIVVVIILNVKKNPPGGAPPDGKGKLGKATPENLAYKERLLSDQHYRKY